MLVVRVFDAPVAPVDAPLLLPGVQSRDDARKRVFFQRLVDEVRGPAGQALDRALEVVVAHDGYYGLVGKARLADLLQGKRRLGRKVVLVPEDDVGLEAHGLLHALVVARRVQELEAVILQGALQPHGHFAVIPQVCYAVRPHMNHQFLL